MHNWAPFYLVEPVCVDMDFFSFFFFSLFLVYYNIPNKQYEKILFVADLNYLQAITKEKAGILARNALVGIFPISTCPM